MKIVQDAGVSEADQEAVLAYARQQFQGLREGSLIRYKFQSDD